MQHALDELDAALTETSGDPKLIFKVMGMVNRRWPALTLNSHFEMTPSARREAVRLLVPLPSGVYQLVAFYYDAPSDALEVTWEKQLTVAQAKRYFTAQVKARVARDHRAEERL